MLKGQLFKKVTIGVFMKKYESMSVRYSRGCPFNREFRDIRLLNGEKPRMKSIGKERLYYWRLKILEKRKQEKLDQTLTTWVIQSR